jgi:hypothetical protein
MTEFLHTLQTNKFTRIFYEYGENGIAPNRYRITKLDGTEPLADLLFQNGVVGEEGANGIMNEDLLCIVLGRMDEFQVKGFECEENSMVILKLKEALQWLRTRDADRGRRGVYNTHNK